jgi:superfamily II DNA or RNA helicase
LTATPERSDGLIRATFALLGRVAYEVPESAIADKVMQVKIHPEETETEITDECLNADGTINYVKLIEHLTTDPKRNRLIAEKIIENKHHSCLILSDRLNQLEELRNLLPYEMQEKSAFINGKMQSKKAKAEREQAIEDMRTGKRQYLFASYSLCREGLDVPRLDRLFFASPAKFSAVITQAVGRVQRTFPGKETPVVYDFVDVSIGFCERAYKERKRSYRKCGAEICEGLMA